MNVISRIVTFFSLLIVHIMGLVRLSFGSVLKSFFFCFFLGIRVDLPFSALPSGWLTLQYFPPFCSAVDRSADRPLEPALLGPLCKSAFCLGLLLRHADVDSIHHASLQPPAGADGQSSSATPAPSTIAADSATTAQAAAAAADLELRPELCPEWVGRPGEELQPSADLLPRLQGYAQQNHWIARGGYLLFQRLWEARERAPTPAARESIAQCATDGVVFLFSRLPALIDDGTREVLLPALGAGQVRWRRFGLTPLSAVP